MLESTSIMQIVGAVAGIWAIGFSVGKTAAWVRGIGSTL